MIQCLKIKKGSMEEERLLFNSTEKLKNINILFGGNGVGKSTLLKGIFNDSFVIESSKDIEILSYVNSKDNGKICPPVNISEMEIQEIMKFYNVSVFSEGQSIVHYVLSFLKKVEDKAIQNKNKTIVVLIDEMDSGLSDENIELIVSFISEILANNSNIQIFISSNHYYFIYAYKEVLDMYTGKLLEISSYEDYMKRLKEGYSIMLNSGKRNFDYLNII